MTEDAAVVAKARWRELELAGVHFFIVERLASQDPDGSRPAIFTPAPLARALATSCGYVSQRANQLLSSSSAPNSVLIGICHLVVTSKRTSLPY